LKKSINIGLKGFQNQRTKLKLTPRKNKNKKMSKLKPKVFFKSLQEITIFLTENFNQTNPPYGFFAPMSNLTKVPFWTSQFGPNYFD
jgi:hypothetical protein